MQFGHAHISPFLGALITEIRPLLPPTATVADKVEDELLPELDVRIADSLDPGVQEPDLPLIWDLVLNQSATLLLWLLGFDRWCGRLPTAAAVLLLLLLRLLLLWCPAGVVCFTCGGHVGSTDECRISFL